MSEKIRIGVIGVGNRGVDNIAGVSGETIAALCDVDERYLDEMGSRYPHATRHRDFREMLAGEKLDAVMVCTPDHTHAHAAAQALNAGLHVYCERPLAHDIHECRLLARLAAEKKRATQMGNQHHAAEGYRRAVEILQAGALGPVSEVHAWTNRPLWRQGLTRPAHSPPVPKTLNWDLWLGPAPERPYSPAYHPEVWKAWWDFGCGALGDFGPHILDPVVWGLQLGSPSRVAAETSEVNAECAPAWSIVRFEFPAIEQRPALTLTWYDGNKQPPEALTGLARLPVNGALVFGERGKLFIPELGRTPTVLPKEKGEKLELPPASLPRVESQWAEWIAACKGGPATLSGFDYGARLTEICHVGNIAVRAGEPIEWDAEHLRIPNLPAAEKYLQREYRDGWKLEGQS